MPAGVTEAKAALRQQMAALSCPDWQPLLERFLALPELETAHTVMLFYGVGREPDTVSVIDELLRRGKTVALPRCLAQRRMEARVIASCSDLVPGTFGIPEPGEDCSVIERDRIDLILVPNLCCDKHGYRLGHGGGYYDRYLAGYSGMTVALCPQAWFREKLPRDEFDLPVRLVLSETKAWRGAEAPRRTLTT